MMQTVRFTRLVVHDIRTDGHITSCGYRSVTAMAQSEIVKTSHGHRTGSVRLYFKCVDTV